MNKGTAFGIRHRQRPRLAHFNLINVLLLLATAGFAARFVLLMFTVGSEDIATWFMFAEKINNYGLAYMYQNVRLFNHPPLMGYLAWAWYSLAEAFDLGFHAAFKLPMVLADTVSAMLLWNVWKRRNGTKQAALAVAAYSLSLLSITVTGYHGNTDSLCIMFCLLSAFLIERKMPLAAGLALAAALNVKVIPLLLIPAFGLMWRSWRDMLRFSIGLSLAAIPFLPFIVSSGSDVYRNVLAYNSFIAYWGIMLFLQLSADNEALAQLARQIEDAYVPIGRYLIMGCILVASCWNFWKRRWNAYQIGAICFAIFLVFTPGFGVQYLIYFCPLLFAINIRWGVIFSTLAGIFVGLVYYSFWDPAIGYSLFVDEFPMPSPLVGLLVWMMLIQFLLRQLRPISAHATR